MQAMTANDKLEILVTLGADVTTLVAIATVMGDDDFSDMADDLVGEYTGEGNTYDLFHWASLKNELLSIFE